MQRSLSTDRASLSLPEGTERTVMKLFGNSGQCPVQVQEGSTSSPLVPCPLPPDSPRQACTIGCEEEASRGVGKLHFPASRAGGVVQAIGGHFNNFCGSRRAASVLCKPRRALHFPPLCRAPHLRTPRGRPAPSGAWRRLAAGLETTFPSVPCRGRGAGHWGPFQQLQRLPSRSQCLLQAQEGSTLFPLVPCPSLSNSPRQACTIGCVEEASRGAGNFIPQRPLQGFVVPAIGGHLNNSHGSRRAGGRAGGAWALLIH